MDFLIASLIVFSLICIFIYDEPVGAEIENIEVIDETVIAETEEMEKEVILESLDRQWEAEKVIRGNYAEMKVSDLREIATSKGIIWRNARGKNKHLRKAELLKEIYQADRREQMAIA